MKKITYIEIFFKFFNIGLMTIGGGYAMISVIEKELCKKTNGLLNLNFLKQ